MKYQKSEAPEGLACFFCDPEASYRAGWYGKLCEKHRAEESVPARRLYPTLKEEKKMEAARKKFGIKNR